MECVECAGEDKAITTAEQPITRTELREELRHYATKADLGELRVELHQIETRLIKWMVGLMVASSAVATSLALLIQRLIGS